MGLQKDLCISLCLLLLVYLEAVTRGAQTSARNTPEAQATKGSIR